MLQVAGHSDRNGKLKPLPDLDQLRTLVLGPGHIFTVERETLSAVPNLWGLSMGKNVIKTVGSWFGGIRKLEKLILSWNEIDEIKENAFQPLVRLEYLELRHNHLHAVEEWHFASLTNLDFLHLSYNNISHIAGKSFSSLSRLKALTLDHNKLSSLSNQWLQGLSTEKVFSEPFDMRVLRVDENPFRCTCALGNYNSLGSRVYKWSELKCRYPPSLSGRKIAGVFNEEMPCPPPTVEVSRQDHGVTLVCEVFWEKQPEIRWLDPSGKVVGERGSLDPCDGAVTTRLENECPTTQSPGPGTTHSTDDAGLPYIGKSTSTLRMSQQAYRCWTEGSFRCDVQSTAGNVFANLPLTKSSEESKQDQKQEDTVTAAVYTTTPARRNAKMTVKIVKTTDKNAPQDGSTPAADKAKRPTGMTAVYTSKPTRQIGRMTESMSKTTGKNPKQDGTTPATDKEQRPTAMTAVYTSKPTRQNERMTENMSKTTEKKPQHHSSS
ncbi:LRFN5 [Branchiostoma lanceolatum]|uniref:LRFN5 protein n=1 Tax=Branchiostoma lanceolatum TaxID=7740 RepID=A0A8J9ZRS0_BRALA|nr:LRFN5 [Branchiostoma lanceolatum]